MINICPNCKNVIGGNCINCPKCGINILDFMEDMQETSQPSGDANDPKNNEPQKGATPVDDPTYQNSNDRSEAETTVPYELMQLKERAGIIKLQPITKEQAEKDPDNVVKVTNAEYGSSYYRKIIIVPSEQEDRYLMLRISNDLHFIATLQRVPLNLSITIAAIGLLIGLLIWCGSCV